MKIRKIVPEDRPVLAEMMQRDEDHKDKSPDLWYEEGTETMAFEDEENKGVIYIRLSRVLRVDVQFDPEKKMENMKLLMEANTWISEAARKSGFRQVIFDSISKRLIRFCCKRLGFKPSPDEFVKYV